VNVQDEPLTVSVDVKPPAEMVPGAWHPHSVTPGPALAWQQTMLPLPPLEPLHPTTATRAAHTSVEANVRIILARYRIHRRYGSQTTASKWPPIVPLFSG
jgi:hypothetical protein